MPKKPLLYLIDGAGYYYRAYFAIRQSLSNSRGTPTNAVYGFAMMLKKILKDKTPDLAVIAFDSKEKTFRHEMYGLYKAHRPDMPEDLAAQLPYIDRLADCYNLATIRVPGYEADDIIGTAAVKAAAKGYDVVIVSSDKDMMQLVAPGIRMFDSMKDKSIGPDEVERKIGVPPGKVADVLGLMGDSSDNIPGVPGVGEKTAMALVKEYGGMEAALEAAATMTKKKLRENLVEFAEQARLSRRLATIALDAPVDFNPDQWRVREPDTQKLRELFTELEFTSMLDDLEPSSPAVEREYVSVLDTETFQAMIREMRRSGELAVDTETTSPHPVDARLVGMSFSCREGKAYYLPLRHDYEGVPAQLSPEVVFPEIKRLLEDDSIPKYGQNIKYDMIVLKTEGIDLHPIGFDTMIASYLLDPARAHGLSALSREYLGEKTIPYSAVCGKGSKSVTFDKVPIDKATDYAAEDADMTYRLAKSLEGKIRSESLIKNLLEQVEIPLTITLAKMERNGVMVDAGALKELSLSMGSRIGEMEKKTYETAGEVFNINSPKQLGVILFDKLKLPYGRKTKTGFSTDQATLENLALKHRLPELVVEYRRLAKLKNTYVDALPKMINPSTGRIHTSFNQTVTATGRLSSSNPNLQNIPVRTGLGREIRRAFVAPAGGKLVSADYSQIELRLLACFSSEKVLLESFHNGEDIHARTAAEVFGVHPDLITEDMRRVAKTVNFGIIYGQTAFGLARELKIPRGEAQRYIDNYFDRYPGIRRYFDQELAKARKNGYVATLLGRRRYLPEIGSSNKQAREFAERNAINTPIQGSAADLIKLAMISIDRRLTTEKLSSRMILQVHDELLFESPDDEVDRLIHIVREEMENVAELDVPLTVVINAGDNWDEAH